MSTPEGEKRIPEWGIFDRLDELEKITLELMEKTDTTEPTLKDTAVLAEVAFLLGVGFHIVEARDSMLAKNVSMDILKAAGLSEGKLDAMDKLLTATYQATQKKQDE